MLNFLENPMMRVCEPLLLRIVSYWDPDQEAFIIQGHMIKITIQDIYFSDRISPLGGGRGYTYSGALWKAYR